jgi:ABC-2 type transport system ATP-binding protein
MRVGSLFDFLRPFYPSWDRDLERALIRQFELPLDRKLNKLSRGMRMKAALASALAFHPKLIVLDEPFTGLDPLVRDELIQGLLERVEESTAFISSHDLGEIESFASHIGYLERGELRLSEELSTLSERFREVELTFDAPPSLPANVPETWMQLNSSAAVVRFVETRFDQDKTNQQIRQVLGVARSVTFSPMSLRSIFLVMAKAGRLQAQESRI